jgi:hypothetical protein
MITGRQRGVKRSLIFHIYEYEHIFVDRRGCGVAYGPDKAA